VVVSLDSFTRYRDSEEVDGNDSDGSLEDYPDPVD
jgi:hypothetical protein